MHSHFHGVFLLLSLLFTMALVMATTPSKASPSSPFIANHKVADFLHFAGPWPIIGRSSPSSAALDTLQKQLGYEFISRELLNRAITHASYSLDNNRALSVLGLDAIRAAVAVRAIRADLDVSSKSLNQRIEAATGRKPCAAGGRRLGMDKVVKVAGRTNASADSVVCGAYRAVFGAVAVDAGTVDEAGRVFWNVAGEGGRLVFDL